jgi:hypothetical protein
LLIEGCKFPFYRYGVSFQNIKGDKTNARIEVVLRRNLILDSYSSEQGQHAQGFFPRWCATLVCEENYFIHNGWLIPEGTEEGGAGGQATEFNHGIYAPSNKDFVIKRNVFIDSSSSHIKTTRKSSTTNSTSIVDNFFLGAGLIASIGANLNAIPEEERPDYWYFNPNFVFANNVSTKLGRLRLLNEDAADGLWLSGLDGAVISRNVVAHPDATAANNWSINVSRDPLRNVLFADNVFYKVGDKYAIVISANNSGSTGIVVQNNKFQLEAIDPVYMIEANWDITTGWTFSGNKYYSSASEKFWRNGSQVNMSGWNSWTGGDDTFAHHSFTNTNVDIEPYMTSIGETATVEEFISLCRAQDRYDWDANLMAHPINEYIRDGFDVVDAPVPIRQYCEGEEDPVDVSDLTPEFFADVILADANVNKLLIQVASDEGFTDLLYDSEVTLDSALTEDGTTEEIVYGE